MSISDSDGFKFVSYKKGRKGKTSTALNHGKKVDSKCISPSQDSSKPFTKIDKDKITSLQYDLERSDFFNDFKESLNCILYTQVLKKNDLSAHISTLSMCEPEEPIDIVCYGLGTFSSCMIARYQLAFLLALKDLLKIKTVSIYDPVFSSDEKDCLAELGFNVVSLNEKARRPVSHRTIFFMPHCDLPLYNNLLWSNWTKCKIAKVIVIGNSFSNYKRLPSSQLEKRGSYINLANKFVTEIKMSNNYVYKDIFNDMSIHHFKDESLTKLPLKTWLEVEEPIYELEDSINYS